MNAKNLHKHSLPVLGIFVVTFVLSISLANHLTTASTQGVLAKALFARLIKVEPMPNGLAHFKVNYQKAGAAPASVDVAALPEMQTVGASSGKLVRLSFLVEALNPTKFSARK